MKLAAGNSEDDVTDDDAIQELYRFYSDYREGGEVREKYVKTLLENAEVSRSSFFKIYAGKEKVRVEIYRDDARGGEYSLRYTLMLGK